MKISQPPPPSNAEAEAAAAQARKVAEDDKANAMQERAAAMTRNTLLRFGTNAALAGRRNGGSLRPSATSTVGFPTLPGSV
jgi:hypothetical protein